MQHHSNGRVVPPRQPQQTQAEVSAEITRYINSGHWDSCCSEFLAPWAVGPDGKYGIGSKANYALFWNVIKDLRAHGKKVRSTDITEAIFTLASNGVFERKPQVQVVEKPVEPPKPTARDLHNRQVKFERSLNDSSTSPIRGAKSKPEALVSEPKSVLIEEQRVALEAKKRSEDATIAEAQRRIQSYAGHSHAKTYSARAHLTTVFTQAMDEGLDASAVLARVDQALNQFTDNGSIR